MDERRLNPHYLDPRIVYVSAKTMADLLRYAYEWKEVISNKIQLLDDNGKVDYRMKALVEDKLTEFSLTMKKGKQLRCYTLDKVAGEIKPNPIHGAVCYSKLVVMSDKEIPVTVNEETDMNDDGKIVKPFSASPFLWSNPKYDGKRIQGCISYDINSSYAYAMCQDMPDTSASPMVKHIRPDEIGFDFDGNILETGMYSSYVFKKMPSPFKHFAEYYYKKKAKTTGEEHQRAKDILNLAVGYLQRKNPFLRATIVGYANNRIKSYMDENTVYCNTDSLVSLKPRNDLSITDEMGDFKVEHKGDFAYIGMNYQWNNENPKYRGVPSKWFIDGYDILKDGIPPNINDYSIEMGEEFRLYVKDNRKEIFL